MKILMLNYEFPPIGGGAGRAHLYILKEFAKRNDIKVDVLTSASEPGVFVEQFAENIVVHKVGVHKKNLHYWRRMEVFEWLAKAKLHYRRLIKQSNYDLIHIFFGIPTGLLCLPHPKCSYIVSLRGSDVPGGNTRFAIDYKVFGPLLKTIWKNAAVLVACSEGLKQRSLRFFEQATIRVIPNGVESDIFYPAEQRPSNCGRLITVGRLSVTKRIDLLIDAVELLKRQGSNITLTIAGGGSSVEQVRQLVERRNLCSFINVLGRVPNDKMPDLYREHDIFVSATMQEGMSNAMLEAMASGLPIVTTRCEGVEELIGSNGIIAEDTPAAIAKAVMQMINDKQLYTAMAEASRKRACLFSWTAVADQYVQCYRTITSNRLDE